MCDPPRIYPSLQEYTPPPFSTAICDPPRIYPSFSEYIPFSTNVYVRPSQNLPLPPRIYPNFHNYMRPSQNLPLLPRIYPLFNKCMCDPRTIYSPTLPCDSPRIYPSLPEYTPFSTIIILCDPPRIYPSLPESTHLFNQFMCATLPVCDVRCPCL